MSVSLAEPTSSVNSGFQCSTYSFGDSQVLIPGKISGKPDRIFCRDCHTASIPAPGGATFQTQYCCPECSDIAPEDVHFDRCQFDDAGHRSVLPSKDIIVMLESELDRILQRTPPRISEARRLGELWAINATPDNVARLPQRAKACLILTYWSGLSSKQAAELLGITSQVVRRLSMTARKKLESYTTVYTTPQPIGDDRFQATTEREQDAEPEIYTSADLQATQGKPL